MRSSTSTIGAALLILAACSQAVDNTTTTTAQPAVDTTTTTTVGSTTTSSSATTSTSTSPTTTTTLAASTLPDGVAIISSQGGIMGIWDGDWTIVTDTTDLPGEAPLWQVFGAIGEELEALPGEVIPNSQFCEIAPYDRPAVSINELVFFENPWLAVQAEWPLVPHNAEEFTSQQGVYIDAVLDVLAGQGLTVDTANIRQLVRFDLEGDGVDEVIVIANEGKRDNVFYDPATNSPFEIVLLRKVIEGEVRTAILQLRLPAETWPGGPEDENSFPFLMDFEVMALADLNGDGTMEIALRDQYYEGAGLVVWEYVNDDIGPVPVLDIGCGA